MKEKINDMVKNHIRIVKYKFTDDELKIIERETSFLDKNVSLSERCYNIINNINKETLCPVCKKEKLNFLRISKGYRSFCSCSCKNKYIYEKTDIKIRISESLRKYQRNLSKYERNLQQNKRKETMIKKGIISDPKDYTDLVRYRKMVGKCTNMQEIENLKNFKKRGRTEVKGSYQLDHMFSIVEGFKQNIAPYIIGNICNLEMIPSLENDSKKAKCSISKEDLFEKFDRNVIKLGNKFNDYPERE